jgi:hypothetical protein
MELNVKTSLILLIPQIELRISDMKYVEGDESDLGNELGYCIGQLMKFSEEKTEDLIHGIRHGISLTNETH